MRTARGLITNERGQILLAQRSKLTFMPDLWELPGGKIDGMESAEDAFIREAREEIGVDVELEGKLMDNEDVWDDAPIHTAIFHARVDSDAPIRLNAREHQSYGWFTPANFPRALTSTARAALDQIA